MMPTVRAAAVSGLLLATLVACGGDDEPAAAPAAPAADTPCLVTADQLREITGTTQEIHEVDAPGGGLGTQLFCETALDDRDVAITWTLQEPSLDPPPTHEEQRTLVDGDGIRTREADLGDGQSGWVGAGRPIGLAEAQVVTLLDDLMLDVIVTASDDDSALTVSQIRDEAVAVARAVVAGRSGP